jgi:MoaA/NifB/PqqE/SkfB family radical SAM enzyme
MKINSFSVILTYRCNLNCSYCLREPNSLLGDIPFSFLKSLILSFKKKGLLSVSLTGGEATVYPYFWELMDFLEDQGLRVFIESNGVNLNLKFLKRLIRKIPKEKLSFLISLDSYKASVHDACRGSGSFAKAVMAIKNIRSLGIPAATNMVISGSNPPSLMDFFNYFDFLVDLGVSTSHLSLVVDMGRGKKEFRKINPQKIVQIGKSVVRFRNRYKDKIKIETGGLTSFIPQKLKAGNDYGSIIECGRMNNPCFSFKGIHPCLYLDDFFILDNKNNNFDFLRQFRFLRNFLMIKKGIKNAACTTCVELFCEFKKSPKKFIDFEVDTE